MIDNPESKGRAGRTRAGIALQRRIDQRGYTQATFARELGRSQPWVSQSLLDDAERTLRRLALSEPATITKLVELLGWDYETLRLETGTLEDVLLPGERAGGEATLVSTDLVGLSRHIPVYDLLSAGPGSDGGTVIEVIDIPETWKGDHVGYEVSGDSMSPEIPNGSVVVVRQQDYASPGNEIVCWTPEHGMLVKYLDRVQDGLYVLTSYNPDYKPIWTSEIRIYGVVVEVRKRRKVINGNHGPN